VQKNPNDFEIMLLSFSFISQLPDKQMREKICVVLGLDTNSGAILGSFFDLMAISKPFELGR
jgi:hypothetical protein